MPRCRKLVILLVSKGKCFSFSSTNQNFVSDLFPGGNWPAVPADPGNSCLLLHKAWQISGIAWVTLFTALNSKLGKRKINTCKPAVKKNYKDETKQKHLSGSNKLAVSGSVER